MRDAVDRVGEARVADVAEGECGRADRGRDHLRGIPRRRIECRSRRAIERAGIDSRARGGAGAHAWRGRDHPRTDCPRADCPRHHPGRSVGSAL